MCSHLNFLHALRCAPLQLVTRPQTPFDIATAEVEEDEYEDSDVIQALLAKMS